VEEVREMYSNKGKDEREENKAEWDRGGEEWEEG